MLGVIDFHQSQPTTTGHFAGLRARAQQLLGEPLLFARRGYPDELKLHFGTPVESKAPKGRTLVRGSYTLGAVASSWVFKLATPGVTLVNGDPWSQAADAPETWTDPLPEDKLDELLRLAGGQVVTNVKVETRATGYVLTLLFADGSAFVIVPATESSIAAPDVPDWELFTPFGHYLRVGPGLQWAYLPSELAENTTP